MKEKYSGLFIRVGLLFFLALVVFGVSAKAQVISGDLVGTVFDKTGAVVPNASVEAVNVDTKVKYTAQANEAGEYRFNNLPVGKYDVSVMATNFATTTVSGLTVELNKTTSLPITLEIKGAVTQVEVSGAVATLDTTTSQITNTFETKLNQDLPTATVGLGVLNLSLLSSGVASSGGIGAGTGPSVAGQRPRNNSFTIEGVDNNNKSVTGPLVTVPNDAVAEFSVLQNQFSPDFGHSSGGQFNTIVKSGTNQVHGDAYIYSQNRNFNAVDQSTRNSGFTSNQRFDNNRMGATVGGPIVKDKLFYFGAVEYNPVGQASVPSAPVCAPTAAGYSALNGAAGVSANNLAIMEKYVAPASAAEVAPTKKNLCGSGQLANGESFESVNGVQVPEGVLSFSGPNYTNNWAAVGSIDYNISASDQLRGRYVYNSTVGIDIAATLPVFYQNVPNKFHLVTINEYHTFGPSLTNEFRIGYNRFTQNIPAGNFSFPGLDVFPNVTVNSLNALNMGPDGNAPQFTIQNTYQASEALSWTKGAHTLKFGVEGRKLIAPAEFTQRSRGDYEYTTLQQYLDDLSPDYLSQRSVGLSTYYGDQSAIYWFVNDNWRVRPNLTFNLGVRYEYTTIPFGERSQVLNQDASAPGLITFDEPRAPKNNWAPRVGVVWSPGHSGKTAIRAGFSEAFDVLYDNIGILSLPPQLSVTENSPLTGNIPNFLANGGLPPGNGGLTVYDSSNPKCKPYATPTLCARAFTSTAVFVNQKDPKSINWSLGVQHTFWQDWTAEVRYIGTRGIHMPLQEITNLSPLVTPSLFLPTYTAAPSQSQLNASTTTLNTILNSSDGIQPQFDAAGFNNSALTIFKPDGASTYHGLATQLTHRMSHGFQLIGSYTFSHTIDNSTADFHSTDITPRRPQDFQDIAADRANSALDHRHRVTVTLLYDMPYFKDGNWLARNVLGNWEFAPIYTYQSGEWGTVQSGVDSNLNGDSAPDRAVFNPSGVKNTGSGVVPLCTSAAPVGSCTLANVLKIPQYVVGYLATNPNAEYIQAYYGALATVGRNTLILPPINNFDLTAVKRVSFSERFRAELGAQAFNLLNHPQFIAGSINTVNSLGVIGSPRLMFEPQRGVFNVPSAVFPSNARSLQLFFKMFF